MNPEEYERMYQLEAQHWYFRGKRQIVRELLLPLVGARPLAILDAGCGTGGMLPLLAECGDVYGVDPFADAVDFCCSRGFNRIAQASVTALPFPDDSFDVLTSFDVIEHVDDDRLALRELYRVLRPGGVLMVTVPAWMFLWSGHDVALHHKRRYSEHELRSKVLESGFRITRCTSFNSMLFPMVAAFRVGRRMLEMEGESSDSSNLPWKPMNGLLFRILKSEARLLKFLNLPLGVSLALIARKEPGAA